MTSQSARCPYCHDLFIPDDNNKLPTHYLDTWQGQPACAGSGLAAQSCGW
jgi:hypothetical protein